MIQINVNPEQYYNCPPPEITEKMIDWVLLTLHRSVRGRCSEKITSVNIRANRAYTGCKRIHFYVTFNDDNENEFHKVYEENLPLYQQNPQLGHDFYEADGIPEYGFTWNNEPISRWYWVQMFVSDGIDMGEDGIEFTKRVEELKAKAKIAENIRKEKEHFDHEYKMYLRLHEKFKNYKPE